MRSVKILVIKSWSEEREIRRHVNGQNEVEMRTVGYQSGSLYSLVVDDIMFENFTVNNKKELDDNTANVIRQVKPEIINQKFAENFLQQQNENHFVFYEDVYYKPY